VKITDEQKQRLLACAAATATTTSALAAAGTLCIYAGASAVDTGVTLLISSACTGEMIEAYTNLAYDLPQGDMYDVEYTEPVEVVLPKPLVEFGAVLQDFAKRLLLLNMALRNLHLSYVRAQATEAVLESNRGDPQGGEYQDAKLFHTLHRQATWRNLVLCNHLHHELLSSAPRVNLLWHRYKLQLPRESRLNEQEVDEIFTTIWQERASDIAAYKLAAFGVDGFTAALQVIRQKGQLTDPALLLDEPWHKYLQLLSLSFQQALDDFYIPQTTPS
jgi:hypothetical protein